MDSSNLQKSIDIDFLPAKYREEFAKKKSQFWRVVASAVVLLVLMIASALQWHTMQTLAAKLEEINPVHEAAHDRTVKLTTLNKELAELSARADLLIYLSHPWPRTQILAAIVEPMPESIKLSELTISRWQEDANNILLPSQRARNARTAGSTAAGSDSKSKELRPVTKDLKQLRAEFDEQSTLVQMAGETTNVSELHLYLGEIAQHSLIMKAELRSIESGGRDSELTTFRARIFIKPGYDQPGGPTGPVENAFVPKLTKTAGLIAPTIESSGGTN